jgi:uncharacterized membrane protein YfcA
MAIIYQDLTGPSLRGTLSSIFTIGTIISILALVSIGKFGWNELQLAGVLIPGIIIGFLISTKLTKILDHGLIRPILLWIAVLAACGIVFKYYF